MKPIFAVAALSTLLGLSACQKQEDMAADSTAAAADSATDTVGMAADGAAAPPQPNPAGGDTSPGVTPGNPDGSGMTPVPPLPTTGTTLPDGGTTTPQGGSTTTPP